MNFVGHHNCGYTRTHAPHDIQRGDETFTCPGVPHDHTKYCCAEHNFHVKPHRGCILR